MDILSGQAGKFGVVLLYCISLLYGQTITLDIWVLDLSAGAISIQEGAFSCGGTFNRRKVCLSLEFLRR